MPRSTLTRSPLLTNQVAPSMLHHRQTLTRMTRSLSDAAKRTNTLSAASRGSPQTPTHTCPQHCCFLHPTASVRTNSTSRLPSTWSGTSAPPSHKAPPTTTMRWPPYQHTFTTPLPTTINRTLAILLTRLTSHSRSSATQTGAATLEMLLLMVLRLNSSRTAP